MHRRAVRFRLPAGWPAEFEEASNYRYSAAVMMLRMNLKTGFALFLVRSKLIGQEALFLSTSRRDLSRFACTNGLAGPRVRLAAAAHNRLQTE